MSNGNGSVVTQICNIQESICAFVDQEEKLREEKNRIAADFRDQIKGIKVERVKLQKTLSELQQSSIESDADVILDGEVEVNLEAKN